MGLDMYLTGKKFYSAYDNVRMDEDGFLIEEITIRLGYWRKHPNLHGYIVNTFGPKDEDGQPVDNCDDIELDAEQLGQIIQAVEDGALPHTEGFFFGSSDGSEKAEDLEIFGKALGWLAMAPDDPKPFSKSIVYRASW